MAVPLGDAGVWGLPRVLTLGPAADGEYEELGVIRRSCSSQRRA